MPPSFNPRPRTGGDLFILAHHRLLNRFNPRPRTGGDLAAFNLSDLEPWVSIRAPARGATRVLGLTAKQFAFQSAPPHGGRLRGADSQALDRLFQSAPPHGGRRDAVDALVYG